jgi:hypothetical protein
MQDLSPLAQIEEMVGGQRERIWWAEDLLLRAVLVSNRRVAKFSLSSKHRPEREGSCVERWAPL